MFPLLLVGAFALIRPTAVRAADTPEVFTANCASCHGADGRARTPAAKKLRVKTLVESKLPDAEIERQIASGVIDAKGKARMPAFKDKLSPEEITTLVAFVKTLRR